MAKPTPRRFRKDERSFVELVRTHDELAEGVRLRIAHDVLQHLAEGGDGALDPRVPDARMQLDAIRITADGTARLTAATDEASSVAQLVWAILAGRAATNPSMPPLRDVTDEIPADVDELMQQMASPDARVATVDALFEAFERASRDRLGSRDDVARILGLEARGLDPLPPASSIAKAVLAVSSMPPLEAPPAPGEPASSGDDDHRCKRDR